MTKLTKAQTETLAHCQDWSAPYEVVMRRHEATSEIISGIGQQAILTRLKNAGLVDFHRGNWTYRITAAGRTALQASK